MHVDGFRFDLAATLARQLDDVDCLGSFFDIIHQDPVLSELGLRLTGSSDLFHHTGRRPHASINFVTAHDGFILHDGVSYDRKHNQANGEDNRDGSDHDLSWNCGVEGRETGEPVTDDDLLLFNGAPDAVEFTLPAPGEGRGWRIELDTSRDVPEGDPKAVEDGATYRLEGRSMALLASPLAGA